MPDFSVVICTYNGENRLPDVLEKLQVQQPTCDWEVVVVDNNSQDCTAAVVRQFQLKWRSDVPLRYCFEPQQGLAFARRRAIAETQSPLIGFLDDDTWPDPNWVNAAFEFSRQHPEAGAYGSSIKGSYETPPPEGFHRVACCLAIIDRGTQPFQYSPERGVLPAGAGMVVRRQAWVQEVPPEPKLAGVKAGSLAAKGEDVETLSYLRRSWPIWHNPAMRLSHIIPKERLERNYLLHLFWHIGLSRYPLRKIRYQWWQWPLMVILHFFNDLRKELLHLLTMKQSGTVESCEQSLLLGSLLSPFYYQRSQEPKTTNLQIKSMSIPLVISQHLL